MESPERNESIPAPVDQGSPFFKYLCGLSPIKPARSVHVVQTYAELSLPPPPAVFTSPPNPHRGGGRVKRGLVVSRTSSTQVTVETVGLFGGTWVVDKENKPAHSCVPKSCLPCQGDDCNPSSSHISPEYSQQHLCSKAEREVSEATGDTPTKFEYGDVADYLADPSESGLYATASSQLVAKSYILRSSPGSEDFGFSDANNDNSVSSDHHDRADSCDDATNCASRSLGLIQKVSDSRNHFQLRDFPREERRDSLASRASGSSSDLGNVCVEKPLQVDKDTAAMAFLLVGDAPAEEDNRAEWSTETETALPDFPGHQTSHFSAHLRSEEEFDLAASKTVLNEKTASADTREGELARKDLLGQRGVRRRCLDFETSVRRKSMGGGGSRKSLPLRSKPLSSPSAVTSSTTIPPSVLCERAAATSDATNSATVQSLDGPSDLQGRSECTMSGGDVLSPGLLRVSRCSFQRSSDFLALEQGSVEQSRALRDSSNPSSVGIPSGIGLHLNSLTGSISFSPTNKEFKQTMGIGSATKGAVASILGMPVLGGAPNDNRCEGFGNSVVGLGSGPKSFAMGSTASSFGPGMMISMMERSRLTVRESLSAPDADRGILKSKTLQSLTMGSRQSLEGSRLSRPGVDDKKFGSVGKKRLLHQDTSQPPTLDFADEYDSPRSPKKRRKSPSSMGEKSGESCKRCNCKKSKCLKLYCECFAAGTYCVGSCTCQDCFNKPEHEETVMSTRQQIESRNPLAFAPKIIHSGDASPKHGVEEIIETPASARHKRGCNCKKSLCLKKYCECYQAGVGCSEGCRCEGCRNMYGRKEGVEDSDDKEIASDALERGSKDDEFELAKSGFQCGAGKIEQPHKNGKDLSPITPSFQYTGQGRTLGRISKSTGKKRSSSPLAELQSGPKLSRSPANTTRSGMSFTSDEDAHQTPDLRHTRSGSSPISTPKLSRVNQLSPRWDGLGDICTLTPLPQPPLRPTPASISTFDRAGASPVFSRQSTEPISSYQPDKLDSVSNNSPLAFQEPLDHSPLSSEVHNSQAPNNRPTPCTPCLSSSAFPGKDSVKAGSGQLPNFLLEDDGTPDFLKYSDNMNSPVITKSSSPKQKRVSPPHFEGLRDRKRGDFESPARSSPGLRSGRKFILQALPSLPPLMPLSNSPQGQAGKCPKKV